MADHTGVRKAEELAGSVVKASDYHRTIDGTKLFEVRTFLGVSQRTFAERCDHSQQFQAQIEAPKNHELLKSRADTIEEVIDFFIQQKRSNCIEK